MIQLSNTWDEVNQMYDITFCIKYANNFTHWLIFFHFYRMDAEQK